MTTLNAVASTTITAFVPSARTDAGVELAEVAAPVPSPNQALVAVEAYSINRGETYLLERPRDGWRPGQDVAGHVLTAAADGSGPQAGSRVVGHAWDGGWAPRVAVATDALVVLPDGVSATLAATLPLAGLTALRLLRAAGPLRGLRVLITGASGGVGHLLVELAAAQCAHVTAVARTAERGERLLALGAEIVVSAVAECDGGFDVVFESVGGGAFTEVIESLAPGATVWWFGQASREPVTLDFFAAPAHAAVRRFTYWPHDQPDRIDLQTLVDLAAAGRIHPEIGLLADWRETPAALVALRERRVRGNAVLTIPLRTALSGPRAAAAPRRAGRRSC